MRLLGRITLITALILAVLAGGIVGLAQTQYAHELLEDAASEVVGHRVHWGSLSFHVGSTPRIEVTDLRVAAPDWAAHPQLLAMERGTIDIEPAALFESPIRIKNIDLEQLAIHLESSADGEDNWTLGGTEEAAEEPSSAEHPELPVIAESISVTGLMITMKSAEEPPRLLKVDVEQTVTGDRLVTSIDGTLNDTQLHSKIMLSPLSEVIALRATRIEFEGQLGEVATEGSIGLTDLLAPRRPTVDFTLTGPSAEYLTERLGIATFSTGPLNVRAAAMPDGGRMSFTLTGQVGQLQTSLTGTYDDLRALENGEITVAISGPSAQQVGTLVDQFNLPDVPFSVAGQIIRQGQRLELTQSHIAVGQLEVDASGHIPNIAYPTQASVIAEIKAPSLEQLTATAGLGITLSGGLASKLIIATDDNDADVSATLTSDYGTLNLEGNLSREANLNGSRIAWTASGDNIRSLLELIPSTSLPRNLAVSNAANRLLDDGWRLSGETTVQQDQILVSEGQLALGEDLLTFDGSLNHQDPSATSRVTMALSLANLRSYLTHFVDEEVSNLVPATPLELSSAAIISSTSLDLADIKVSLAGLEGRGGAQVDLANGNTSASFALTSRDASQWIPASILPHEFNEGALKQTFKLTGDVDYSSDSVAITLTDLKLGETSLTGTINDHFEETRTDVDITFSSPDILMFAHEDILLSEAEALPINGSIAMKVRADRLDVDDFNVSGEDGTLIHAQGDLRYGATFDGTDFALNLNLASLRRAGALAGLDLPDAPLGFTGAISGDARKMTAKDFVLSSGDSQIRGDFRVENPDHPKMTMALNSELLDLRPFLPAPVTGAQEPEASPSSKDQTPGKKRLIPDQSIDLSPLAAFDADINLQVDRLISHRRKLQDVTLVATVTEGGLFIQHAGVTDENEGTVALEGFARPDGKQSQIALRAVGDGINVGFPATTQEELSALPRLNFKTVFYGSGVNYRELAKEGTGFIQVTSNEGLIPKTQVGFFTNDFIAELLALINPLRKAEKYTTVKCGALVAAIEQGEVRGDPMFTVVTDHLAVISKAKINLNDEQLFATFNTVPQKGLGISATSAFNPFIGVGGTLSNPQITMDPQGTLVQGGLAFFTGGLSLVGKSFLDRVTTDDKICEKAVEKKTGFREQVEADYSAL